MSLHDPEWRNEIESAVEFLSLIDVEVPTIAALNGHAIGGGMGLAVVCDFRIANREARYGVNFVRLGLHPGMATTYLLPRLMGVPRATASTARICSPSVRWRPSTSTS